MRTADIATTGIWTTAAREAVWLGVATIVLAGAVWSLRSDRLPLRAPDSVYELELPVPTVAAADARELYDAGVHLFVDTRTDAGGATIPGALNVRGASFDEDLEAVLDFVYPEDPLVLFDDGGLQVAATVASRFLERGYENLVILYGGLDAWRDAGGEINEESP